MAAALVRFHEVPDFAIKGEDNRATTNTSPRCWTRSRKSRWTTAPTWFPRFTRTVRIQLADIRGGTEETTTGVIRLRSMAQNGVLSFR